MSGHNANSTDIAIPLCVDMDGTLFDTDVLWVTMRSLLWRNPLWLLVMPFWWMRGRAFLKAQIASRATLDPAKLPYILPFLEFLKEERAAGRKLVLATASDRRLAEIVARHVGLFSEVIASDGRTNIRGAEKGRVLSERFGRQQFDYAGNSHVDYPVWQEARRAIVVNASPGVTKRARELFDVAAVF